jgi:hypothetical protein
MDESIRCKHGAFRHEKEWRLIHVASAAHPNDPRYSFRAYNGRVVPFAKVKLQDDALWKKIRVVVGPCPEAEMKESIAAVVSLLGYTAPNDVIDNVVPSAIPYRHW